MQQQNPLILNILALHVGLPFVRGLSRDGNAVENAVAYPFSNSFVEGANSKLKMLKRTMYKEDVVSYYQELKR